MRRDYTEVGHNEGYTRKEIDGAIQRIGEWIPYSQMHDLPLGQGYAILQVIQGCNVPRKGIKQVALHGSIAGTYGFYGLDVEYKNAHVKIYMVDKGLTVTPLAMDVQEKDGAIC